MMHCSLTIILLSGKKNILNINNIISLGLTKDQSLILKLLCFIVN